MAVPTPRRVMLGSRLERIEPGKPQQNGRHERMHLTLKTEATKPAAANVLQQQARFDAFVERFNHERPHQALGLKVPADVYARSPRVYRGLEELAYPFHDATYTVTHCGRICFQGRKVNLSHVFAGQNVGVTQVGERVWNPGILKDWANRLHDVRDERLKRGVWRHVFADVRHARAHEGVLQLFDCERELSCPRFEEIVLNLRVEIRIHHRAVGFQYSRRRYNAAAPL
jgi:Integrase core domain